jgi:hypothetical protein
MISCKYCEGQTSNTEMCDRCQELDTRIRIHLELAEKIMDNIKRESKKAIVFDWKEIQDYMKAEMEYLMKCKGRSLKEAFMETLDDAGYVFMEER